MVSPIAIQKPGEKPKRSADELFKKFVFGTDAVIVNPYWGDLGANPGSDGWLALPDFFR